MSSSHIPYYDEGRRAVIAELYKWVADDTVGWLDALMVDAGLKCSGDPRCDYQAQCECCFEASEQQYADWFWRAGYPRSMFRLVIDQMRETAHADAIREDRTREHPAAPADVL